jgi:hypothetical protein
MGSNSTPCLPCGVSSVKNGFRGGYYGTGEHVTYYDRKHVFFVFLSDGDKNGIGHPERDRSSRAGSVIKIFCCSKNLSSHPAVFATSFIPNPKTDGY